MPARDQRHPIRFTGAQTIRSVAEARRALAGALAASDDVGLDLTEVSEADVMFLQTIVAAAASARVRRISFTLAGPPGAAVVDAVRRAGLGADPFWSTTTGALP
ncbi:MAG: STAS domain-containing protein [Magnetospirillum sp.]|nr:STAS domain-containing protein [Magnetospirillum sp.]